MEYEQFCDFKKIEIISDYLIKKNHSPEATTNFEGFEPSLEIIVSHIKMFFK